MPASIEKLMLMNASATLAAAVASNFPDQTPVDMTVADPALRVANSTVWELHRIFYHAILKALEDGTSWPDPKVTSTTIVPEAAKVIGSRLGPVLQGVAQDLIKQLAPAGTDLITVLRNLIGAIPTPGPGPVAGAPIPNP